MSQKPLSPLQSLDTYSFNFDFTVRPQKDGQEYADELRRVIKKGAKYNIRQAAKFEAARGHGFKGAVSLKSALDMAQKVAEEKMAAGGNLKRTSSEAKITAAQKKKVSRMFLLLTNSTLCHSCFLTPVSFILG